MDPIGPPRHAGLVSADLRICDLFEALGADGLGGGHFALGGSF